MKNKKEFMKKTAYGLFFVLMTLQIVLGLVWIIGNAGKVPDFAETKELLEISRTWVPDDYVGVCYPALLWLTKGLESVTGIPYNLFVYLLQTVVAFLAAVFFLQKSGLVKCEAGTGKWRLYFGAAYLVTIPMAAQCHVAVLPFSLAASSFLVVLGEAIFLCKKGSQNVAESVWIMGGGWLLGALLLPEYLWLIGFFAVAVFGLYMWKNRKCYPLMLIAVAVVLLVNGLQAGLLQEPRSRGRMEKSFSGAMLRRFVWPHFFANKYFWNSYITDLFDDEELLEISENPENVARIFGLKMEETYGKEMADREYRKMVGVSLEMRTKEIVFAVGSDALAYACPQVSMDLQLKGVGVSYTGWNYSRMQGQMPVLTKYYVKFASASFYVLLALGCVALLVKKGKGDCKKEKSWGRRAFCLLAVLELVIWYTMSGAGMQDYRNSLVTATLWAAFMVKMAEWYRESTAEIVAKD